MTAPAPAALLFSAYMLAQVLVPTLALAWNLPRREMPVALRPLAAVGPLLPAWAFLATRWGDGPILTVDYLVTFAMVLLLCMASVLALFQHRGNIKRLIAGEENRLDFDKISKVSEKVMQRMQKKNK